MNNALKHIMIGSLFIASQSMTLSAFAHGPQAPEGFVGDSTGVVVTDNYGECVKTGFPPPANVKCVEKVAAAPAAAAPTPAPAAVAQTVVLSASALFDYDKSNLRPAGKQELDAVVTKMKGGAKVSEINVTGHTDSRGSNAYNQELSERRANSVRDYMIGAGVDTSLITSTSGMGETKPVASNDTDEGRQQNRRVEIVVESRN